MVWCVCMCKSHRDAIWGSPSRFCPLAQFALRMQKPGPRAVSVLGLGICAALFPQVASLTVPLPPMGVSGLTRPRVTDNKGGFPPGPVPMGSREPGTLGRAAQQASQSRYFNCRAPPPPAPGPLLGWLGALDGKSSAGFIQGFYRSACLGPLGSVFWPPLPWLGGTPCPSA